MKMETGRHTRWPQAPRRGQGVACAWQTCRLLVRFPDYFKIFYFSKYSKTEKESYSNSFGVRFLTESHTLGILPELWY